MAMVREQDIFFIAGPAIDFAWTALSRPRAHARPKAQGPGPRPDPTAPATQQLTPGSAHSAPFESRTTPLAPRTAITAVLVGAVSFLLAFAPQLLAYQALNGQPRPTDLVARKMIWTSPHALEVLFSPAHGFFAWTPLAIAGAHRRGPPRARHAVARSTLTRSGSASIALVMVAAQIYVTGAVDSWTLQGSFGQRRFVGPDADPDRGPRGA